MSAGNVATSLIGVGGVIAGGGIAYFATRRNWRRDQRLRAFSTFGSQAISLIERVDALRSPVAAQMFPSWSADLDRLSVALTDAHILLPASGSDIATLLYNELVGIRVQYERRTPLPPARQMRAHELHVLLMAEARWTLGTVRWRPRRWWSRRRELATFRRQETNIANVAQTQGEAGHEGDKGGR